MQPGNRIQFFISGRLITGTIKTVQVERVDEHGQTWLKLELYQRSFERT
jgi:hypothetical protein